MQLLLLNVAITIWSTDESSHNLARPFRYNVNAGTMNRNSSDYINPAPTSFSYASPFRQILSQKKSQESTAAINTTPTSSRYASPFRLLSPQKKSRESTASSSSVSSRKKKSPFALKTKVPPSMDLMKALKQLRGPRSRHKSSLSSIETETTESSEASTPNVMDFLIGVCPEDVLPKILAFAGPQKTAALSKVNRVWRDVINEDWTWRVLCEDLYKVCFLN
jgi:hypothetical protein